MAENKTALLICGGGSKGILQAGMLKAIKDLNIHFDIVYAGSVGALNGILFLQDQIPELIDMWMNIKNKDVYNPRLFSLWKLLTNDASIYDSAPLEKLIRKCLDMEKIKKLPYPFIVNVANLSTRQPEAKDLRHMEFEEAVHWLKASASPPILFPSVTIDGDEKVDTGIVNNYFISQAVRDGYTNLICLTPTNSPPSKLSNLMSIIEGTISTASYGYLEREIEAVFLLNRDGQDVNLIVVRPKVIWGQGLIDFNYKQDRLSLINFGYTLARNALQDF